MLAKWLYYVYSMCAKDYLLHYSLYMMISLSCLMLGCTRGSLSWATHRQESDTLVLAIYVCVLWSNQAQCCSVKTPAQALTVFYIQLAIYYHFISLSTAPRVAIVNSECRCVHLPNGGLLCDPVGCELLSIVHVKYCPTMILFSAHCTTGDTVQVEEEKQDKGKLHSNKHTL